MKLAIVAFAALSAVIAAAPADASPRITSLGVVGNGLQGNGILQNGIGYNGLMSNGVAYNAFTSNGIGINGLLTNGVAEQGGAGAKLITCTTGAEPVCERTPSFKVQSITLGNGKKLELR